MLSDFQTQVKAAPKPSFTPVRSGLLQRSSTNQAAPSSVPPIVHEVLRSSGQPLDANTRAFMESRFGYDFSRVRVHIDAKSADSARAVNALAYTVGHDVVFGAAQYEPKRPEGRQLLAHELTHVMQNREMTTSGPIRLDSASSPAEIEAGHAADEVRPSFLQNAGTVLQRQKGGDMTFDDDPLSAGGFNDKDSSIRVKPGPVRTTLIRPERMTNVRGETYSKSDKPGTEPGAWIQGFLEFFGLWTAPSLDSTPKYSFQLAAPPQRLLTLTEVIDTVMQQGALDGQSLDRNQVMRAVVVHLPRPAPGPSSSQVSFYLTFSIVRTLHFDVSERSPKFVRPDPLGGQAAAQITLELHKENESGAELSWIGQLSTFQDAPGPAQPTSGPYRLQSAYSGFQAAWVFAFLQGALQLQPIAQALIGYARAQQTVDGMIKFVPTGQLGVGGQIVYAIPGTNQQLQIGGQAAAAFTAPGGAHSTVDLAPSIFLQIKF